jgi:hypothetical protein
MGGSGVPKSEIFLWKTEWAANGISILVLWGVFWVYCGLSSERATDMISHSCATRGVGMESEQLDYRRSQAKAPAHGSAQSSGGIKMTKSTFSKTLFAFVAVLALICGPMPASARHTGGSKGGGGSHGGGALHGNGHFSSKGGSFKGGGHFYGGSRGSSRVSSARMDGGRKNGVRMSGGSYAKSGGFSSRPSSNFARNSNSGGGNFGSSAAFRNFSRFAASPAAVQSSRSTMGKWQSFGNSTGQSMLASARNSRNAMGGWHSFGNVSRSGGGEMSRGYGNSVRNDSQWRSFGNSGNASFAQNRSGFSSFGPNRATASNQHSPSLGFSSNRFSANLLPPSRFSSFSSFSSGRSTGNFGGSRFGVSGFGASDFGNSPFGSSGFSNSAFGSGVSLIPNLFGGLLNLGTSVFGGHGLLAVDALSLAVRLFVSAIGANGFGQGDSTGGDIGFGQSGFNGNFGLGAAPIWPACGPGAPLWAPSPAPGFYCGLYAYQPLGWSAFGPFGHPSTGFNFR